MNIYKSKNWTFRKNDRRKSKFGSSHPALVVEDKNKFANIGLTHSAKRGHHKNIELSKNPNVKDSKKAYLRDDLQFDDKQKLNEILSNYKLSKKDIKKVYEIINKKR